MTAEARRSVYAEEVPASRWLLALMWAGAAGAGVGGIVMLLSDDLGSEDRWIGGGTLALTAVVLIAVARWFDVMRIDVSDDELRVGFGPFGRTVRLAHVETAEVTRYRWLPYGGWGIRYALGGRRAYSQPFLSTGVELHLADRTRLYVTSREPDRLRAAIESARRPSGG